MTTAAPKAIQGFATGVIKDKLSEMDDCKENDVDVSFAALLKMELVQRGVLVSPGENDIASWDAHETLECI